tara:strand:- start:536 stop:739 length:204 start_codon:yes stop_codon:yes gene_type:complete
MPNKSAKARKQKKVALTSDIAKKKKLARKANQKLRKSLEKKGYTNIKIVNGKAIRYQNEKGEVIEDK